MGRLSRLLQLWCYSACSLPPVLPEGFICRTADYVRFFGRNLPDTPSHSLMAARQSVQWRDLPQLNAAAGAGSSSSGGAAVLSGPQCFLCKAVHMSECWTLH